jgi:hypothetical protein
MGVSGQLYPPAALAPGQTPGYLLNRRLGGSRGHSGRFWDGKIFCTDRSLVSFLRSIFHALIRYIKVLKRLTNALECRNVSLLYSNQRHVSVTHVPNFRVARTKTIICWNQYTYKNSYFFIFFHSCTVQLDAIRVFYLPTDAQ